MLSLFAGIGTTFIQKYSNPLYFNFLRTFIVLIKKLLLMLLLLWALFSLWPCQAAAVPAAVNDLIVAQLKVGTG